MHTKTALTGAAVTALLAAGCAGQQKPADEAAAKPAPAAARTVVVPRLVGLRQDRAHARVDAAGLKMRWTGFVGRLANGHTNVDCVKVFRQSPVEGERRAPGASIAVLEIACETPTGNWHDAPGVTY